VAARSVLDEASATVTVALTPAQSRRSRNAQVGQAPVVALVEAAGAGYPTGYAPTGTVLQGLASWYGPGFLGSPTASGSPYDPERLTCAHKTLPLGTVLRVSPTAVRCPAWSTTVARTSARASSTCRGRAHARWATTA
jgi:rare lipoprotein A (peptidoglycan hydrolase)